MLNKTGRNFGQKRFCCKCSLQLTSALSRAVFNVVLEGVARCHPKRPQWDTTLSTLTCRSMASTILASSSRLNVEIWQ